MLTQIFRCAALLLIATQIQCRDQAAPGQSVHEPIQGQKPGKQQASSNSDKGRSQRPQDGTMSVKGQGQGVHLEPPVPCSLDTQSADQGGSKTKADPTQINTIELGVQTDIPKGKGQWTPYMQHRCR